MLDNIRRVIKCFFGLHKWGPWVYDSVNDGYYDFEQWEERWCFRCGSRQEREV